MSLGRSIESQGCEQSNQAMLIDEVFVMPNTRLWLHVPPPHSLAPLFARAAKGEECALHTLDLSGNRIARALELAVLAGCPRLRKLALSAAPAARGAGCEVLGSENPVCALPGLRAALAAVLPHVDDLDGAPLAPERAVLPHASAPGAAAQARKPYFG